MTIREASSNRRAVTRMAGLLYLAIIVLGLFSEIAVRGTLIVEGEPGATADNILGAPWLFRMGFAGDALMVLADIVLAVLLCAIFAPVDRTMAMLAGVTRAAQAAVLGMNLLTYYGAMLVLSTRDNAPFAPDQRNAFASLLLSAHAHGYDLALLFFGVHCLVLGRLITKAPDVPRILGGLMIVTGVVYLTGSFARFLWPGSLVVVSPLYAVAFVSELSLCVWFLAKR